LGALPRTRDLVLELNRGEIAAATARDSDEAERRESSRQDVLEVLGGRVRVLRKAQGRGQTEMARDAGMHQSEWSRIERGKVEPGLLLLLGLQRALGVHRAQFAGHLG